MRFITKLKPGPPVIPDDLAEELARAEVLNTFTRRPKSLQKRYIRWINRAGTDAERRKRLGHVTGTMTRVAQYEYSRRRSWVGQTRTT